jgi:hypothetical protein
MARKEREQGLLTREIKDYVPHVRSQDIEKGGKDGQHGHRPPRQPRRPRFIEGAARSTARLEELRQESRTCSPRTFRSIYAKRGAASAEAVARSKTLKEIAATGRKLTPDAMWDTSTEAIYKVTPTRLVKLVKDDKIQAEEIAKAAHGQLPASTSSSTSTPPTRLPSAYPR